MCHRSINYVADMIEKKYGTPWIKVNFIGARHGQVAAEDRRVLR
jgi:nitrogenase molybdenum-iron protein alpha/beta subunit